MATALIKTDVSKCHGSSWEGASKGNSERVRCQVSKLSLGGYAS